MKKLFAIVLAMVMVISMVACKSSKGSQTTTKPTTTSSGGTTAKPTDSGVTPVKGGTMVVAVTASPSTLDAKRLRGPGDRVYGCLMYETLLNLDEKGDPVPFLCESMTPNVEDLSYTIKLKQGIKFHDGSELDAEVCKWNLDAYKEKGIQSKSFMGLVDNIEVVDKYTVKINLTQWDTLLPVALARQGGAGYMVSKLANDTYGEEYCSSHPVTTGPFKFVSWEADVAVTLERFDDYWQGEPYLDGIEITVFSNALVAQAAMENGDVHVIFLANSEVVKALDAKGFAVITTKVPSSCATICFESMNPDDVFYDIRVRQAAMHAIDGEAIAEVLWPGRYKLTNQYAPPDGTYFNEDIVAYPFDQAKAKELLAAAGYPNGGCKTSIYVNAGSAESTDEASIIKEQLEAVGFEVELEPVDTAGSSDLVNGWYHGILMHTMGVEPGTASQIAGSYAEGLTSGIGLASFKRPAGLDEVIRRGQSTVGEESIEAFKEAARLIFEEGALLKAIAVIYGQSVISPLLHDSGISSTVGTSAEVWKAWLED